MPNLIEIRGVTRKPLVDLTRNDQAARVVGGDTAARARQRDKTAAQNCGPCQVCGGDTGWSEGGGRVSINAF